MSLKILVDKIDSNSVGSQTTLDQAVIGNGGTVTQGTSKSTTVVLNKRTGAITMHAANLATLTPVSFTLTNSEVKAKDLFLIQHDSAGTAGAYVVKGVCAADGTATITVTNVSAGTLGEAIVLRFFTFSSSDS